MAGQKAPQCYGPRGCVPIACTVTARLAVPSPRNRPNPRNSLLPLAHKACMNFRRSCSLVRRTVSQWADPRSYPISRIEFTRTIAVRVSLADCFCPMGQRDRGFENPRLFKDRPTDGKRGGCAAPLLNICVCNSVGNCTFRNLRQHGSAHYFVAATVINPLPQRRFKPA